MGAAYYTGQPAAEIMEYSYYQPHHHHQILHQPLPYVPQQSSSYLYTQPPPPLPYEDVVRTLFVAGLPQDVKSREIYNLFRDESSHLRSAGTTQGFVFDLEKHSALFIDLAKSNPRSKRPRIDDERPGSEKRIKGNPDSGLDSFHMPGTGNSASNTIGYPSTQSTETYDGRIVRENSAVNLNSSKGSRVGTPCPTLFVANLASHCTEEELIHVFSRCSGYLKLKMQHTAWRKS